MSNYPIHLPIYGIRLTRSGDVTEVSIETDKGRWDLLIRDVGDGPISHIIEPAGIRRATEFLTPEHGQGAL